MDSKNIRFNRALDFKHGKVEMAHGAGGKAMAQLIEELFIKAFDNDALRAQNDQARIQCDNNMVMATDSHVISPLFFPGGDIGSLSIHGTVNDIAMSGATPKYISCGFILEEGYPLADLKRIVESMAKAAQEAGVSIVTGDTKVVERGKCDGVYINTAGVGSLPAHLALSADKVQSGDKILISGTVGDHGVAIMSFRENLSFETTIESDSQSLNGLTQTMVTAVPDIRLMRDPTRGGIAATLNEIAHQTQLTIVLDEKTIPVQPQVHAACEFLGLDVLNVANEGKLLAICPSDKADELLALMRKHPQGQSAAIIGEVSDESIGFVKMKTSFGGSRMVDWINAEQLPRIC